jgi:magnesium chelatase subunit D
MTKRRPFPFAAVAGLDLAKHALLLLAVEPRLKGVLIGAPAGTGKTTLARSFRSLMPDRPFVALPVGITADRLLGSLDMEKTCATGTRQWQPGVLSEAGDGLLFIDQANLLDSHIASQVGMALGNGAVSIEREGLSRVIPTRFSLIGTFDSQEGIVSPAISTRAAIVVLESPSQSALQRIEILERASFQRRDPAGFAAAFDSETEQIRAVVSAARLRLPRVKISRKQSALLALSALKSGVEGNCIDIFASCAACANAALRGGLRVAETDLEMAVRLVIAPRAKIATVAAPEPAVMTLDGPLDGDETQRSAPSQTTAKLLDGALQIDARDTLLPPDLIDSGGRRALGARPGSRGETTDRLRGRYVGASPDGAAGDRVAVDATLRAAAPWQKQRSHGSKGSKAFHIEAGDLRYKRFKRRAGALFLFVVDASGSMALNRVNQAKGAILRLLKDAYLNRDRVAMISFRGRSAEMILPPTQSVDRARRALESLPVGGGTPLAAGLESAILVSERQPQTVIVLLTDGRANVAISNGGVRRELERLGAEIQRRAVDVVVIDTQARFTSRGEAHDVARMLGAKYFHLPRDDGSRIYEALRR